MKKIALVVAGVFLIVPGLFGLDEQANTSFAKSNDIKVTITSLSLERYGPMKEDRTFKPGETVFVNLELKGLAANEKKMVVVQADIAIPELKIDSKNLIDDSTEAEEVVPMYFQIPIGPESKSDICNVKITIRDMVAKTYVEFNTAFNLKK